MQGSKDISSERSLSEIEAIEKSVEYVKYVWQTFLGVRMAKLVPIEEYLNFEEGGRFCRALFFLPSYADAPSPNLHLKDPYKMIKVEAVRESL